MGDDGTLKMVNVDDVGIDKILVYDKNHHSRLSCCLPVSTKMTIRRHRRHLPFGRACRVRK